MNVKYYTYYILKYSHIRKWTAFVAKDDLYRLIINLKEKGTNILFEILMFHFTNIFILEEAVQGFTK